MKARALVIGNSHVASLMPVWREGGQWNTELDFLAAPGTSLSRLATIANNSSILSVRGNPGGRKPMIRIVPDAAQAKGSVDLDQYPVIAVYGLQLLTGGVMQNHLHGHHGRGPDKWIDLLEASNSGVSRRAWQMAAQDFVRNTFHYRFVLQFPQVIRERILCLPCPFPNSRYRRSGAVSLCDRERIEEALAIMARELQALGVRFSGLPSALTDTSGYLTASEYMKDPVHLNAQGARIVLSFIDELVATTAGSPRQAHPSAAHPQHSEYH